MTTITARLWSPAGGRARRERGVVPGVVVVVAGAWIAMVLAHAAVPPPSQPVLRELVALGRWAVMCVAMMVPTTFPAVRHVARNSLGWRRRRAVAWFLAGYVGVWALAGIPFLALAAAAHRVVSPEVVLLGALVLAAAWLVLPYQRRFLVACHRTVPLPPRGRRAVTGAVRFGLSQGSACIGMCWPLMFAAAVVVHGDVVWMAALTVLVLARRTLPRPSRTARPLAVAVVALAATLLPAALQAGATPDPTTSTGWFCTLDP